MDQLNHYGAVSRRRGIAAVAVATALGVTGCAGTAAPRSEPTAQQSAGQQSPETQQGAGAPRTSATPSAQPLAGLKQRAYIDQQAGFRINPPRRWRADESGRDAAVTFFEPKPGALAANVMVGVDPAPPSLAAAVQGTKRQYSRIYPKHTLRVDRAVTLQGDRRAHLLGINFSSKDDRFCNLQLFVLGSQNIYIVTATTSKAEWRKYSSVLESSLLTFQPI